MRTIYVPLPEDAREGLRELARRELREPREQAAWLIVEGLRRAGLDVDLATRERAELEPAASR
jgi:hypothetical protein